MFSLIPPVLANLVQKDPGVIVGPIMMVLGVIINFFYDVASVVTKDHALGVSIILVTIVARTIMLPFGIQTQKSSTAMQKLQPELNKIKAKYGDTKDPELQRKMQLETQELYTKNKINPFAGCLPLLFTMPIFFALNALFRATYVYVKKIGEIYDNLAMAIINLPDYVDICKNVIWPIGYAKVPKGMAIDLQLVPDLTKMINSFSEADWATFSAALPASAWAGIEPFYAAKQAVESFAGISLVGFSGLAFPGVLIPVFTALTTLLTSYVSMRTMSSSIDPKQKSQQTMMMVVMPIMMFVFTINMPSGVGLYWIVSSIYQAVQQYFLHKYYSGKIKIASK